MKFKCWLMKGNSLSQVGSDLKGKLLIISITKVINLVELFIHSEETEYWHMYRYEPFFTIRLIGKYNIIKLYSF